MAHLMPDKLHIRWLENVSRDTFSLPRCYTLTHSDATGDLFLTIGVGIYVEQIAGWHTRFMRDEVTAEWRRQERGYQLHLDCHVSGGVVFGPAGWRYRIFRHHLPQVLEAFRYGDRGIYQTHPKLEKSPVKVRFSARQEKYNLVEDWGEIGEYSIGD